MENNENPELNKNRPNRPNTQETHIYIIQTPQNAELFVPPVYVFGKEYCSFGGAYVLSCVVLCCAGSFFGLGAYILACKIIFIDL